MTVPEERAAIDERSASEESSPKLEPPGAVGESETLGPVPAPAIETDGGVDVTEGGQSSVAASETESGDGAGDALASAMEVTADSSASPTGTSPAVSDNGTSVAAVSSIADGIERSLDPRSILVDRIENWIATATTAFPLLLGLLVTLGTASLSSLMQGLLLGLWIALTGFFTWASYRWPGIAYRHASYKMDEEGISIRRGVWWRSDIHVPRTRVQHTDVSQGPLERMQGLGTLVIYTAGTQHAKVDLSGLDHTTALRMRDQLLPREDSDAV